MTEVKDIENKILCGDCSQVMKQIPNDSIDMVITSPPYDNLREYEGYNFDFEEIAKQLKRIVKKDGGVVVWVIKDSVVNGSKSLSSFKQAIYFKEIGFNVHDVIIWEKESFTFPDKTRYRDVFEYIFVFTLGRCKPNLIEDRKNYYAGQQIHGTSRSKDGKPFKKSNDKKGKVNDYGVRFNVWHIPSEKNNKYGHPAPFPMRLVKDCIRSWSKEGDIILDPMMGSGTALIGAKEMGRRYIGIDVSSNYCKIAKERLKQDILL